MIKIRFFGKSLLAIGIDYLFLPPDLTLYTNRFIEREGCDPESARKVIEQIFEVKQLGNLFIAKHKKGDR